MTEPKLKLDTKKADKLKKAMEKDNRKLDFELNQYGGIKTTSPKNVALILQHDPDLKGLLQYNEFTEETTIMQDKTLNLAKWGVYNVTLHKGVITDDAIYNLALYMSVKPIYRVSFKPALISEVVNTIAKAHSYNPIVDYFEKCLFDWDHKPRLNNILVKYLGADNNQVTTSITELWFLGAVAKGYKPETKFDYVLDLVGGQGIGKTTFLQKIAPLGYYTDQFNTFKDKDDFSAMKGNLIINDDEMTASNRASFEEVKRFITMQEFEYRVPYARFNSKFKKRFVMARTTNEPNYLKDKSGDRRFLPIMCNPDKQEMHPFIGLDKEEVKQLWGEAVWLYKNTPDPLILTDNTNSILAENREQFKYTSPIEDDLNEVLDNKFKNRSFISYKEINDAMNWQTNYNLKERDIRKIKYFMAHKGYKTNERGYDRTNKKQARGYKKST